MLIGQTDTVQFVDWARNGKCEYDSETEDIEIKKNNLMDIFLWSNMSHGGLRLCHSCGFATRSSFMYRAFQK